MFLKEKVTEKFSKGKPLTPIKIGWSYVPEPSTPINIPVAM